MSITLIVILLIVFIVLCFFIVHTFDITLIKGVIKAIKGNVDLNTEELRDAVKRFLENRSLNRAHKLYFRAVTTIAGGNTILSFVRGILKVKQGENTYQLDLLYDNGIPVWAVLIIILSITICQCFFSTQVQNDTRQISFHQQRQSSTMSFPLCQTKTGSV